MGVHCSLRPLPMVCFAWGLKITICFQIESYCAEINESDESEARQCLNVTDTTINPPSPVILEPTVEGDFICKDKPLFYSFSCTLYGKDLIWYFDGVIVKSFLPNDTVGNKFSVFQYPSSAPYYSITAVLTQFSNAIDYQQI